MTVLEKTIEAALAKRVKALGGMAEKFTSPSKRSVPDRIGNTPTCVGKTATASTSKFLKHYR